MNGNLLSKLSLLIIKTLSATLAPLLSFAIGLDDQRKGTAETLRPVMRKAAPAAMNGNPTIASPCLLA